MDESRAYQTICLRKRLHSFTIASAWQDIVFAHADKRPAQQTELLLHLTTSNTILCLRIQLTRALHRRRLATDTCLMTHTDLVPMLADHRDGTSLCCLSQSSTCKSLLADQLILAERFSSRALSLSSPIAWFQL